jgi:flagellar biosynthesis protein FlhG
MNYGQTKTLSVTSGKGGVGKSTIVSNLALHLAQQKKKVLILDGDFGLSNIDIMFGVKSRGHVGEILEGDKNLIDIITPLGQGIDLISGGSGVMSSVRMSPFERRALVDAVSVLEFQYDYMLIDTGPGLSDNVLTLNAAAQNVLVVVTPEASSITDAYAMIKVLHQERKEKRFSVFCNMVKDPHEGFSLFQRFAEVTQRFLSVGLDFCGAAPMDASVRKSSINQRLIHRMDPNDEFLQSLKMIEAKMNDLLRSSGKAGLQFFWEQVVGVA